MNSLLWRLHVAYTALIFGRVSVRHGQWLTEVTPLKTIQRNPDPETGKDRFYRVETDPDNYDAPAYIDEPSAGLVVDVGNWDLRFTPGGEKFFDSMKQTRITGIILHQNVEFSTLGATPIFRGSMSNPEKKGLTIEEGGRVIQLDKDGETVTGYLAVLFQKDGNRMRTPELSPNSFVGLYSARPVDQIIVAELGDVRSTFFREAL